MKDPRLGAVDVDRRRRQNLKARDTGILLLALISLFGSRFMFKLWLARSFRAQCLVN